MKFLCSLRISFDSKEEKLLGCIACLFYSPNSLLHAKTRFPLSGGRQASKDRTHPRVSPSQLGLCVQWGILLTLKILFPVISGDVSVYFSGRKPFPVLLKFREKMTSTLCHLYKRKRKTGKCFNYLKMLLLHSDRFKPLCFP